MISRQQYSEIIGIIIETGVSAEKAYVVAGKICDCIELDQQTGPTVVVTNPTQQQKKIVAYPGRKITSGFNSEVTLPPE